MHELNDRKLAHLREKLEQREQELSGQVKRSNEENEVPPSRSHDESAGDVGDQGEARTREAIHYAAKERDIAELRQIADARERMRVGTYGQCVDCGRNIALARLEALPSSERCIECQEIYESTHDTGVRISLPAP